MPPPHTPFRRWYRPRAAIASYTSSAVTTTSNGTPSVSKCFFPHRTLSASLVRSLRNSRVPLLRGFGTISIRGEGVLDSELSEESLALALLGIPPASEDGIALWLLLN